MALFKSPDLDGLGSAYDPQRLSSPQVFLLSMLVFLAIVGFVAAILYRQISAAFTTNPGLNGLILGVLTVGVLMAFSQVIRLFREVRWVNSFRAGAETTEPVLLAPMKALLSRSTSMSLSTTASRPVVIVVDESLLSSLTMSRPATEAPAPLAMRASLSNICRMSPCAHRFWFTDWSTIVALFVT